MPTPKLATLRSGALLGSIIHATVQPRLNMCFQWWFGDLYSMNDWSGAYGVVVFFPKGAIGAFYDVHSRHKWPWLLQNQESFFDGMPADLRDIANKILLQYMLQSVDGKSMPLVTAVFWDTGTRLSAAVPWSEFLENGGHLISIQLLPNRSALAKWRTEYNASAAEMRFAERLFERKQNDTTGWIDLSERESMWLQKQAKEPEAMITCRKCFAELGIHVP